MADKQMFSFHFDVGNSNTGHVGFCARVTAENPWDAERILKATIPSEGCKISLAQTEDWKSVEYAEVYFNPEALDWRKDIDMFSDEKCDDYDFNPKEWNPEEKKPLHPGQIARLKEAALENLCEDCDNNKAFLRSLLIQHLEGCNLETLCQMISDDMGIVKDIVGFDVATGKENDD